MVIFVITTFILAINIRHGMSNDDIFGQMPFYSCIRKYDGSYGREIEPCTLVKQPDHFGNVTSNDMVVPKHATQFCCVPHVTVRAGQHAVLPCNLSKNLGHPDRITWFKASTYSRPIQVIDGTVSGSIYRGARKFNSKKYDGRLSQPEDWDWGVETLVLTQTYMNDTGSYLCARQEGRERSVILPIYLEVSPGLLSDSLRNMTPFVGYNRDPEFIELSKRCLNKIPDVLQFCLYNPSDNAERQLFINEDYDKFQWPDQNWPWSENMHIMCDNWPTPLERQFHCATERAIWSCEVEEAEALVYALSRRWQRYCLFDIYKEPTEHYCNSGINKTKTACDGTNPPYPWPSYDLHNDFAKVWQLEPSLMSSLHDYCSAIMLRFWCMIVELRDLDPNCVHPDLKLTAYAFVPLYIKLKKACVYIPDYYFFRGTDLSDLYLTTQKTCPDYWKTDTVKICDSKGNASGGSLNWSETKIGSWSDGKQRDEHAHLCCEAYKIVSCQIRMGYEICDVEDARHIHLAKFEEMTHNCGFVSRIDCFPSVNKDNA